MVRIGVALAIILVIVFFGSLRTIGARFAQGIGAHMWPLQRVLADEIQTTYERITQSKKSLIDENTQLRDQLRAYEMKIFDTERIRLEHASLTRELSLSDGFSDQVIAPVRVSPRHNPYRTMIIGKGRSASIALGDIVSAHGVVVIGSVVEVFEHTAHVRLFSDPLSGPVDVTMPDYDLTATAEGVGVGMMQFEVSRDSDIQAGDYVTHQYTGKIIGIVGEVLADPRDPVRTVIAHSPLSSSHLLWAHIHTLAQ